MKTRLVLVAFALCLAAGPAAARTIVYHDAGPEPMLLANFLANLACHFDPAVDVRPVAGYHAGDLIGADVAIYLGYDDAPLPVAFLDAAGANDRRVLWIAGNLGQLTARLGGPGPFGFAAGDWSPGAGRDRIAYRGREIARHLSDRSFWRVTVTGAVETYSTMPGPGGAVPHCLRGGNLVYLAENPFFTMGIDDRYFVLADLLHEVYETGVPEARTAMVRLEDLSPATEDGEGLAAVGAELEARGVPFSFGVIPMFVDPLGIYFPEPTAIALADAPGFVRAIKSLAFSGGTMILHGTTHQHGDEVSGDGWEFLDADTLGPLPEDGDAWVRARIAWGLSLFEGQALRPRIWETPHYGASYGTYRVVAATFGAIYERPFIYDLPPGHAPAWHYEGAKSGQMIPYYLPSSVYGTAMLPETMGYYAPGEPGGSVDELLARAEAATIIRDGVASFFFHPTEFDPAVLYEIVDELRDRGFTFVGPEAFVPFSTDPWLVSWDDRDADELRPAAASVSDDGPLLSPAFAEAPGCGA